MRFAVCYAPPRESTWWQFGCAWLGRDAITDAIRPPPAELRMDPAYVRRITAKVRRQGWCARLTEPFRLAAGYRLHDLYSALRALAYKLNPITLPPLQVQSLNGLLALTPIRQQPAVHVLMKERVACLDPLRAPYPVPGAFASDPSVTGQPDTRRLWPAGFGYPEISEEAPFYLALTDVLPPHERARVLSLLQPLVARLDQQPLIMDAIALFVQCGQGPFHLVRRYKFDGNVEIYADE